MAADQAHCPTPHNIASIDLNNKTLPPHQDLEVYPSLAISTRAKGYELVLCLALFGLFGHSVFRTGCPIFCVELDRFMSHFGTY